VDFDLVNPFNVVFTATDPDAIDCKELEACKATLSRLPVQVTFDTTGQSCTFCHEPREIEAIIASQKLDRLFNNKISLLARSLSLTMDSTSVAYILDDDCSETFLKRLEDLFARATAWIKLRKIHPTVQIADTVKDPLELLAQHSALIVGECHTDIAARSYLTQNMAKCKALGVTTLFLEHFCYDSFQTVLDSYMQQESDKLPEPLSTFVRHLDQGYSTAGSFKALLKQAKREQIRIVGLDTSISYSAGCDRKMGVQDPKKRYLAMNYVAVKIIERIAAPKYIALVGSGHVATPLEGIPGIAEFVNQPSVVIETGKCDEPVLQANQRELHRSLNQVSLYMQLPDPLQPQQKLRKKA
ncbi:MAG: membrane-targeted effector domain-containing toxin, partial [Verrucomicrobia bacterium]|nr:membrane-targeted effector domain-containing toxin [Verrucomicrobiota bacterium]